MKRLKSGKKPMDLLRSTDYFISNILKMKNEKLPLKLKKNKLFPENSRDSIRGILEKKKTLEQQKPNVLAKWAHTIRDAFKKNNKISINVIKPSNSIILPSVVATTEEPLNQPQIQSKPTLSKKPSVMIDSKFDDKKVIQEAPSINTKNFERKTSRKRSTRKEREKGEPEDKKTLFDFKEEDNVRVAKANDIKELQHNIRQLEMLEKKRNSIRSEIKLSVIYFIL